MASEHYDPGLPFLDALEQEVRREAERVLRRPPLRSQRRPSHEHEPSSGAPSSRRRPRRGVQASNGGSTLRIVRRSLVLVGLLCLIGATAYGATKVFSGHSSSNPLDSPRGPFVPAAQGRAGSEHWSLRLYELGGRLCRVLLVAETLASHCEAPPSPRAVRLTSADSPLHRYVFGVAGRSVTAVTLHVGSVRETLATHELDPAKARAAGLPAGVRYYLAVLARPAGTLDPVATVRPVAARRAAKTHHPAAAGAGKTPPE